MLHLTPFMERSLRYLTESPNAAPTDQKLAAWVDLQRLSEETADAFRRGQPTLVTFEDAEVRQQIEYLARKFDTWRERLDRQVLDGE
jgi:hypothetical protein